MKMGKLFILSGPSGVGKGTIREKIMTYPNLNLVYSISMTTRNPRQKEREGIDYFFVSENDFDKAIDNNQLLEWAEFVGHRYGTPEPFVNELLKKGKNVLLEIEVQGAKQVMDKRPDAITIFVIPPSFDELEKRIRGRRSESEEIIQHRLEKAMREIKLQKNYNYVIVNDSIDSACKEIANIIMNCSLK